MKKSLKIPLFFGLLIFLSVFSLSWGMVEISFAEAIEQLWFVFIGKETTNIGADAVIYLRLPHLVVAFVIGWGLTVCGAVMQSVMQNPLADPYLLGVSSGAGLGAVLAIAAGMENQFGGNGVGVFAFLGALSVTCLILFFSALIRTKQVLSLLLIGFATNALCAAALNFIILAMANPNKTKSAQFWLMGNIVTDNWGDILVLVAVIVLGSLFFITQFRILDLMLIGDEAALSMGRDLTFYRRIYMLAVAIMVGSIVYVSGIIGFVGLVVPHMVRMAVGSGHKKMLPLAALCGGCFLVWADVLGRNILPGVEFPIGVIVTVYGAPFFVWLLVKRKARGS